MSYGMTFGRDTVSKAVASLGFPPGPSRVEQDDDAPLFPDFKVKDILIAESVDVAWEIK